MAENNVKLQAMASSVAYEYSSRGSVGRATAPEPETFQEAINQLRCDRLERSELDTAHELDTPHGPTVKEDAAEEVTTNFDTHYFNVLSSMCTLYTNKARRFFLGTNRGRRTRTTW